ncbi:phosphotransferase enzyme family protein [Desulfosporosinus sp. SB140]|uniref:phosphotransferase enzyme family protein n=1 Tax=Desulfosporosinus paludis TaxID=3115649 RepID=UPI00388D5DA2
MSIDEFSKRMNTRLGKESLTSHLESLYGIHVAQLVELDLGVFRADRNDGPSWVARLYSKEMPLERVRGDAEILRFLEQQNYPAERCAHPDAVFMHEEQPVLVTNFVQGTKPKGTAKAFYFAAILLGHLNTLPASSEAMARKGGAWHHLAVQGGPREEIDAALKLLIDSEQSVPKEQRSLFESLLNELKQIDDCCDMPQAFIHPDFVPANMIKIDVGNWAVVDWAGAGQGPRIWSLGFLLWVSGWREDLQYIDAVVAGYRKYINLNSDERTRLFGAILARPIIFDCWSFCMGRKKLLEVVNGLSKTRELAEKITGRAIQAFENYKAPFLQ